MIIGIDGNEANDVRVDISGRAGVNQYAFKTLWGLYDLTKKKRGVGFIIFLKNSPKNDLPAQNSNWKYEVLGGQKLFVVTKLIPRLVFGPHLDVFFAPNHYLPLVPFIPMICTIHDLGYLEFSGQFPKIQYWQLKYWSAISVIISKYIICPSKATEKDIVRHYPFASKKVFVIPHGYDLANFNTNISENVVRRVKNKFKIVKNYILFMGTLKPSKNIGRLVEAFSKLTDEFPDYQLVIAGGKGWMYEKIFEKVKTLGLAHKILFTGYVNESDKPGLLKGARAFVVPSLWEGFGMDVLNALGCGTPIVLSRVASLPEIASDAAIYVDPNSTYDISLGIKKVLEMSKLEYNNLVLEGIKRAELFSWGTSAERTLEVLTKT